MRTVVCLLSLTLTAATFGHADTPGYETFEIDAPHHGRRMNAARWYPTDGGTGTPVTLAGNPVFVGVSVIEGAPLAAGRHPVVLLSHGLGGHMRSLTWLAAGLAQRGAVVVAVNHPNTTWLDFDLDKGLDHWSRVQDLSVALDAVLADPEIGPQLDGTRIMALGFSYGGWTALSMGGQRGNLAGYAAYCEDNLAVASDCQDVNAAGIDLWKRDAHRWNDSYADARITHVAAIDPGFTWGLQRDDSSDLIAEVTLIGLGTTPDRLFATDFDAAGYTDTVPHARVERLSPAYHFSALPLCTPQGAAILQEEGEDPVCSDPAGANREALHEAILTLLARDLRLSR